MINAGIISDEIRTSLNTAVAQIIQKTSERDRIIKRSERIETDLKTVATETTPDIVGETRAEQHDFIIVRNGKTAGTHLYFCAESHCQNI